MSEKEEGLFEAPNLDCLSIDPADLLTAAQVLHDLGDYAHNKADAMRQRLDGNIGAAVTHERLCDIIYKKLPRWARW